VIDSPREVNLDFVERAKVKESIDNGQFTHSIFDSVGENPQM
jgi:hypothetical protein